MTIGVLRALDSSLPATPVRRMVAAAAVITVVSAWFNQGFFSHDEHFQILEYAWYKLGRTPESALAWEFPARMRPGIQPLLAVGLFKSLSALGWFTPFFATFLLRLTSGLLALWISLELCVRVAPWVREASLKRLLLPGMLFLWFLPYTHGRFASENWGGFLFFGGLCMMLDVADPSVRGRPLLRTAVAGLIWGAAFYCRFQVGFAIAGAGLWLLLIGRVRPYLLLILAVTFGLMCGINLAIDHWLYGEWVFTPYYYFHANVVEHKAASFGTKPWWFYLAQILTVLIPPFSLVLVALLVAGVWLCRKNVLVWAVVPFVIAHTLVGHKETRFLIPMTYAVVPLLVLAADRLPSARRTRLIAWQRSRAAAAAASVFIALNLLGLAVMTFKPSSETEAVYRWLYDENRKAPIVLYSPSRLPYSMGSYGLDFYRPDNLTIRKLDGIEDLRAAIAERPGRVFVFQQSLGPPDWMAADLIACVPAVQTIPTWAARVNVNNWISRMYVWTIFSVRTVTAGGGC